MSRSASNVIELIANEAARATSFVGFGEDATRRYANAVMATIPLAADAMREMDEEERTKKIAALAGAVRAVSGGHRVPEIVERGLTEIALRLGRQRIRDGATSTEFSADELEAEFVAFGDRVRSALRR